MDEVSRQIGEEIRLRLSAYENKPRVYERGMVRSSADGVVICTGLPRCRYGELLEFENGAYGIALNMDLHETGAVLLNGLSDVRTGSEVRGTDQVMEVPVGRGFLGRVVDPIGRSIDGKGLIRSQRIRPIEVEAPSIIQRAAVDTPLQTGILAIDSMIPIGRGQRELIIGDRQTGKTAIAVDAIINQKDSDVLCIYVAIGQKASSVAQIVRRLEAAGAMENTVVVVSTAGDSAAMQYITPYSACAMAEEFMLDGRDVLIVYDDLSKHAVAYRAMSLLLRRPPGREAYPGDVFYLHSRLLERSARLSPKLGGGSMTALPIVETSAGDISAYIPTNIISITDGQIFLESELFHAGVRPAINVGLSVSRVGGSAQRKIMRKLAGTLRLELAQYRELAVFSQFDSDLDDSTRSTLRHGERLMQTLVQRQYRHYSLAEQIILLRAGRHEAMERLEPKETRSFNDNLLGYMAKVSPALLADIMKADGLSDELAGRMDDVIDRFARSYRAGERFEE